jgi:DNA-directed RNA polymerase subunit H
MNKKQKILVPNHVLVPKHEIMTKTEAMKVLKEYGCKPEQLPLIFVTDPAIMGQGAVPGNVIRIIRKSPTAGESIYYRYVVSI